MRLDQLEERLGDQISIEWRSFLLRPEPREPDQTKFVEYTKSWLRPAEMEPATEFAVWATDNPQPTSSVPPHIAAKAVARVAPEAQRRFHRDLLTAYFTDNRTISEWDVLFDVVAGAGANPSELAEVVEKHGTDITQEVIDEHNDAIARGITAVPTTVIADVLPVPGAQDVDVFEAWITRLIDRQQEAAS